MDNNMFLYIIGILAVCIFIVIFSKPIRSVIKIVLNSAIGGIVLVIFNFVSQLFGLYIGVNALTAVTVGILGIPGFIMLIMLRLITS